MRASFSLNVVVCAEKVAFETVGAYSKPNRTVTELRELIKGGTWADPLEDSAEAVREGRRQFDHILECAPGGGQIGR